MSKKHKSSEINLKELHKSLSGYEAVVADSITQDVPLVEVFVAKIKCRKETSRLVKGLNAVLPIPTLQHLKRVKHDEIILCLSDVYNPMEHLRKLKFDTTGIEFCPRKIKVAAELPRTRKQFKNACMSWPCNFHEDKYLEKLLSGTLFNKKEQDIQLKWMRAALEAARRSETHVGAVVVDPSNNKLIAVGGDDRTTNPAKHAIMVTIDLVARTQNGGVWPKSTLDYIVRDKSIQNIVDHKKRDGDRVGKPEGPYLCTGYDVYVTREPCTMCAMALVHSRASRVFYGCSSEAGALGTLIKLHTLKALNHHYEVFKGLLQTECCSLYKKNK